MKKTADSKKNTEKPGAGPNPAGSRNMEKAANAAYGDKKSICVNAGCALRKKAQCFGFEGCPGFKSA